MEEDPSHRPAVREEEQERPPDKVRMVKHQRLFHSSWFQEKDLGDDVSLRSIDIKEELRRMTLDMVKVTGLLGAVARFKNCDLYHQTLNLNKYCHNQQLEVCGQLIKYCKQGRDKRRS